LPFLPASRDLQRARCAPIRRTADLPASPWPKTHLVKV